MSQWFETCPECQSQLLAQLDYNLFQCMNCGYEREDEMLTVNRIYFNLDDKAAIATWL